MQHKSRNINMLLPLLWLLVACMATPDKKANSTTAVIPAKQAAVRDTQISIHGIAFWVQSPADSVICVGDLLLLPGWDFTNRKWCDSTDVCKTALKKGYRVLAPQMMRSVYATRYFPETRADLKRYPTLAQLDSAIEGLSLNHGFFKQHNLVLGLSTGARGVALLCERKPGFFHAAAALSGDYNQVAMPGDNLMRLTYGNYAQFAKRWKNTDNPQTAADSLKTPLYLGHGARDRVVPVFQTREFNAALAKRTAPQSLVVLHINPAAGHTFGYWRSELPAVWDFFMRHP
jgi:putative tributyrin esterase